MRLEGFNDHTHSHSFDRDFDEFRTHEHDSNLGESRYNGSNYENRRDYDRRSYDKNYDREDSRDHRYGEQHYSREGSHGTKGAFLRRMEDSLHKELNDVLRYCEMSRDAEDKGLYEIAAGLSEIAKEEFTHAYFLRKHLKYLDDTLVEANPEIVELWHKAKHKLHIS